MPKENFYRIARFVDNQGFEQNVRAPVRLASNVQVSECCKNSQSETRGQN